MDFKPYSLPDCTCTACGLGAINQANAMGIMVVQKVGSLTNCMMMYFAIKKAPKKIIT